MRCRNLVVTCLAAGFLGIMMPANGFAAGSELPTWDGAKAFSLAKLPRLEQDSRASTIELLSDHVASGHLAAEAIRISSGTTLFVDGDLNLHATDRFVIDGTILATSAEARSDGARATAPANAPVMHFSADREIVLRGYIVGGEGKSFSSDVTSRSRIVELRGGDGSSIRLEAPRIILDGAAIGGNGGHGGPGSRGGNGGDVSFFADEFTIESLVDQPIVAYGGHGGRGGDGYDGANGTNGGDGGNGGKGEIGQRANGVPGTPGDSGSNVNGSTGIQGPSGQTCFQTGSDGGNGGTGGSGAGVVGGDGGPGGTGGNATLPDGGDGGTGGRGGDAGTGVAGNGGLGGSGGRCCDIAIAGFGGNGGSGGAGGNATGGTGGNGGTGGRGRDPFELGLYNHGDGGNGGNGGNAQGGDGGTGGPGGDGVVAGDAGTGGPGGVRGSATGGPAGSGGAPGTSSDPTVGAGSNGSPGNSGSASQGSTGATGSAGTVCSVLVVDLVSFSATVDQETASPVLTWTTAAEFQNVGFHVYRADVSTESGRAVLSVGERLNLTLVPAKGDATSGAEYTFIDPLPLSSMDENRGYYLEDVDINFTQGLHGPAFLHGTSGNAGVANWRAIE